MDKADGGIKKKVHVVLLMKFYATQKEKKKAQEKRTQDEKSLNKIRTTVEMEGNEKRPGQKGNASEIKKESYYM